MRGTWQTTDGGGRGGLVLVVVALALGSGAVTAAVHALEVIVIVAACVLTAAVLGVVALIVYRARPELRRPDQPGRPIAAPVVYQLPSDPQPRLEETSKAAIGPPREIHLHLDVTPDQLAAILRHHTGEDP